MSAVKKSTALRIMEYKLKLGDDNISIPGSEEAAQTLIGQLQIEWRKFGDEKHIEFLDKDTVRGVSKEYYDCINRSCNELHNIPNSYCSKCKKNGVTQKRLKEVEYKSRLCPVCNKNWFIPKSARGGMCKSCQEGKNYMKKWDDDERLKFVIFVVCNKDDNGVDKAMIMANNHFDGFTKVHRKTYHKWRQAFNKAGILDSKGRKVVTTKQKGSKIMAKRKVVRRSFKEKVKIMVVVNQIMARKSTTAMKATDEWNEENDDGLNSNMISFWKKSIAIRTAVEAQIAKDGEENAIWKDLDNPLMKRGAPGVGKSASAKEAGIEDLKLMPDVRRDIYENFIEGPVKTYLEKCSTKQLVKLFDRVKKEVSDRVMKNIDRQTKLEEEADLLNKIK